MNLYNAVKASAALKGIGINDVADRMNVNRKTLYSTLHNGNPRLSTIIAVSKALDMKASELIKLGEME